MPSTSPFRILAITARASSSVDTGLSTSVRPRRRAASRYAPTARRRTRSSCRRARACVSVREPTRGRSPSASARDRCPDRRSCDVAARMCQAPRESQSHGIAAAHLSVRWSDLTPSPNASSQRGFQRMKISNGETMQPDNSVVGALSVAWVDVPQLRRRRPTARVALRLNTLISKTVGPGTRAAPRWAVGSAGRIEARQAGRHT